MLIISLTGESQLKVTHLNCLYLYATTHHSHGEVASATFMSQQAAETTRKLYVFKILILRIVPLQILGGGLDLHFEPVAYYT